MITSIPVVTCVDVLEHVTDHEVLAEVARVLKPGGIFHRHDQPQSVATAITVAEDILRLFYQKTHDPAIFIKPRGAWTLSKAGLVPGSKPVGAAQ
jgi:2-polyprenyl-3-methyl-5-hydroxy-6-metoxy-1,4-benzoquinol methylase